MYVNQFFNLDYSSLSLIAKSQLPRPPEPRTTPHRRSSDLAGKKKTGMIPGMFGNFWRNKLGKLRKNLGILADLGYLGCSSRNFGSIFGSWSCLIGRILNIITQTLAMAPKPKSPVPRVCHRA